MMKVYSLHERPDYIKQVTDIYYEEWGWHFKEEWDISSWDEMREEVTREKDNTYIFLDSKQNLIGTAAILEEDLKNSKLSPWFTCLYVAPPMRGQGYATQIYRTLISLEKYKNKEIYLWTYSQRERNIYTHWGWEVIEEFVYNSLQGKKESYIMKQPLGNN